MPDAIHKSYPVITCLLCLSLAVAMAPIAAAEEPSSTESGAQSEGAQGAGDGQPTKKTELDKVPLAQLVQNAKAGDVKAQFELGSRLNYGRGMPKDVKEALRWLRRAAQGGQQDAQRLLAVKLYNGFEVPADHVEALRWTALLAEAGEVPAQLSLANMYAAGEGADRNLVRAYMWYSIAAAAAGKKDAPEALEKAAQSAAERRDKVVSLLLPEQEVEAQQMASAWWLKQQGISLMDEKKSASGSGKSKASH